MILDVLVIGGGLLGCFAARELTRYPLRVALLEARADVCMGMSRANTAVVYPGYDTKPGTLKSALCVQACRTFDALCAELGVPFRRRGSLMAATGAAGMHTLRTKLEQGLANGVAKLRLLSGDEARELEPNLSPAVTQVLYCGMTGTVDPWALGIAAMENAVQNGAQLFRDAQVTAITRLDGLFYVESTAGCFSARRIVNCAGVDTPRISSLLAEPDYKLRLQRAEYLIFDAAEADFCRHILFSEAEGSEHISLVPTVGGSLLLGATRLDAGDEPCATSQEGLALLRRGVRALLPDFPLQAQIRSFAGLRPRVRLLGKDRSVDSFILRENPAVAGLFETVGIKTPGMTCSSLVGEHLAKMAASSLGIVEKRRDFCPNVERRPIFRDLPENEAAALAARDPAYGQLVCRCEQITAGEVLAAIRMRVGARSVDGVKRRCGAGMGRCQGGFCQTRVMQLLARELHQPVSAVEKDERGSYMVMDNGN